MEKSNPASGTAFGSKLKAALANLAALPAIPAVAQKLLALKLDTEAGEAQMLALIEQDPQLFGRIIGLANSSATGAVRKINDIKSAAMLLGMKRLKAVTIGIATMSKMLNQPATKDFDPHDLWSHSMTVAIVMNAISQEMPKRIQPDENQIFLAGLLHDIGLMALHFLDLEASEELHRQLRLQPKRPIDELEMELFGITHAHIGALLVQHWQLPKEIIEVVGLHHSPDIGNVALGNPLVRLVNLAEKLLPNFGIAEHTFEAINDSEWRELYIDPALAETLSATANELALQVAQQPDAGVDEADSALNAGEGSEVALNRENTTRRITPVADISVFNEMLSTVLAPAKLLVKWIGGLFR